MMNGLLFITTVILITDKKNDNTLTCCYDCAFAFTHSTLTFEIHRPFKNGRRLEEELSEYQKQIGEQYVASVEAELERWQNARNARKSKNLTTQETMDKELESHILEHGPKTRKIPGSNNEEEDVEDIVGEEDMMDGVLEVDDNRRVDSASEIQTGSGSPNPDDDIH